MPSSGRKRTPAINGVTPAREHNLQGWAVDEKHPQNEVLSKGAVWEFLKARNGRRDGEEWRAGFSYLAAHAGAALSSLPLDSSGEELLQLLMDQPALGCAEDALLEAALRHVAATKGFSSSDSASWSATEVAEVETVAKAYVSRLKLDSLSVRAVLNAVEPLHIVPDERLLSYYRGAALGRPGPDVRGKLRIIEGEHPYSHDDTGIVDEVRVDGCQRVLVEFDRRCKLSEGADLFFFADPEGTELMSRWSREWTRSGRGIRFVVIETPVFYIEFRCSATAVPEWGWKALISPLQEDDAKE